MCTAAKNASRFSRRASNRIDGFVPSPPGRPRARDRNVSPRSHIGGEGGPGGGFASTGSDAAAVGAAAATSTPRRTRSPDEARCHVASLRPVTRPPSASSRSASVSRAADSVAGGGWRPIPAWQCFRARQASSTAKSRRSRSGAGRAGTVADYRAAGGGCEGALGPSYSATTYEVRPDASLALPRGGPIIR